MKYGETLRQRSIPAWSHHNIDYDDIKLFIKERTTPGRGKTVSIPGRGDDKLKDFESALFLILAEQHQRIDLFVRSKAGEIQRRLDHAKKQLKQLKSRSYAVDRRIPVGRLERYSRLENDVIKAGEEIKSLSRFATTQRTAIKKLLKKYKKWTGSRGLEDRFQEEVLDDPKSFTNLDLGSLLDDYSETLLSIRSLYESRLQGSANKPDGAAADSFYIGSSTGDQLQSSLAGGSKQDFDVAFATVPLGERAALASYFVHPDNVVELQVLLLHHAQHYGVKSRANSSATPSTTLPRADSGLSSDTPQHDYGVLIADRLRRFAQEQSSLTVDERERHTGSAPQKAKFCARWQDDECATISAREGRKFKHAQMKRKHLSNFFEAAEKSDQRRASVSSSLDSEDAAALRKILAQESNITTLSTIGCSRSRYVGLNNSPKSMLMAVLDTNTVIRGPDAGPEVEGIPFPFGLLWVRQDGAPSSELISVLDKSHLVERVRGFSLEYHAVWQTCKSADMAPPFWLPMLSQDIRKLPPPAMKRTGSLAKAGSGEQSATQASTSSGSVVGQTESTTAVEESRASTGLEELSSNPPLRSFRKKRRRAYPESASEPSQRYWSEYDHPEDGDDGDAAYVIYIDPYEKSALDRLVSKLSALFSLGRRRGSTSTADLSSAEDVPATPKDDETSSDEETAMIPSSRKKSYGTLRLHSSVASVQYHQQEHQQEEATRHFVPQLTAICMVASLALLVVAYILATTGKHKYVREVDAGVVFAIATSLIFAIIGVASMLGRRDLAWSAWGVGVGLLVVDAVASGGLLAWILG